MTGAVSGKMIAAALAKMPEAMPGEMQEALSAAFTAKAQEMEERITSYATAEDLAAELLAQRPDIASAGEETMEAYLRAVGEREALTLALLRRDDTVAVLGGGLHPGDPRPLADIRYEAQGVTWLLRVQECPAP